MADYGYIRTVALTFDEAVAQAEAALKTEGFGVLCQIDIQAKLKEKLGVDFPRYVILGACNPPLAHHALQEEINLGLLLPCNVIVYAGDRPGTSVVAVLDPVVQLGVTGRADLEPLAAEVRGLLGQALESVRRSAAQTIKTSKGN